MPSPRARPSHSPGRYDGDVLAAGWQKQKLNASVDLELQIGQVLEDPASGWCGAVVRWENGLVVLEDRKGKLRSFPLGPGLWLEGKPVSVQPPRRQATKQTHTASGSRVGDNTARVALPSRIYVEGRHDAELVEKIWGDDLRHVGVVVEYLGGIDDLPTIVDEFQPAPGRRLGVLVDHLVAGSKEQRIAAEVAQGRWGDAVFVTGHEFIDIWAAIRPERVGLKAWPDVPRREDWKKGLCRRLGWPHADQADIARVWKGLLSRVQNWEHLDRKLVTEVEKLIDFVTQDHLGA